MKTVKIIPFTNFKEKIRITKHEIEQGNKVQIIGNAVHSTTRSERKRNNIDYDIVDFIVNTVQRDSLENGFQRLVTYNEIEEVFKINMTYRRILSVLDVLERRKEVADVELDDGYDVVLCTEYAPLYDHDEWECFYEKL